MSVTRTSKMAWRPRVQKPKIPASPRFLSGTGVVLPAWAAGGGGGLGGGLGARLVVGLGPCSAAAASLALLPALDSMYGLRSTWEGEKAQLASQRHLPAMS